MSNKETLEARVARLEAINDIRGVIADYCHYYDSGWAGAGRDPDRVSNLFLEKDGWVGGPTGRRVGREAIREYCAVVGAAQMSLHIAMNPKIEVNGDQASGAWAGLVPLVDPTGQALWVGGRYECQFGCVDGDWKIASMEFKTAFLTPYDEGFGKVRMLEGRHQR